MENSQLQKIIDLSKKDKQSTGDDKKMETKPNSNDIKPFVSKSGITYNNPLIKDEKTYSSFTSLLDSHNNNPFQTAEYIDSKISYKVHDPNELRKAQNEQDAQESNRLFEASGAKESISEIEDFLRLAAQHNITSENIGKFDPGAIFQGMQKMREEEHRPKYDRMHPKFLEGAAKILKDQEERVKNVKLGDKKEQLSNIKLISQEAQEAQKAKKS